MTAKDVVVAITSGALVTEVFINAVTFAKATLVLGGTHLLSVALDE